MHTCIYKFHTSISTIVANFLISWISVHFVTFCGFNFCRHMWACHHKSAGAYNNLFLWIVNWGSFWLLSCRWIDLPHSWKFSPREIFTSFTHCSHGRNFYPTNFLFHVNDYIVPMTIFITWAKIYSVKYFCNARVLIGWARFLSKRKFPAVRCSTI